MVHRKDSKILLYSIFIILLDQLAKAAGREFLEPGQSVRLLGDYVRLTLIENPGMAFGIRLGSKTFFTVFATIASLAILVYLFRIRGDRFSARFALALILGGALGNLIDRILYGKVVDFVDIGVKELRWPVFNVADIAVTAGMIILVTLVLFEKDKERDPEPKVY